MDKREYLISLQFEQGWKIDMNSYNSFPIFDNTIVFSANNKIIGKELYIEFENEEIGYILYEILIRRDNFKFNFNEDSRIYNTVSSDLNLDNLLKTLNKKINYNDLNLVGLKVYGGWEIILNRLYKSIQNYVENEFVFLAINNKNIIEVIFDKEIGYLANTGKLKNKKQTDFINFQDVENLKSLNFSDMESLVDFMENYFIKPD
ncbi:hypothetical protein EH230_09160 [Flavobacterium columnare]|uniref:Uncharacterized protein n=1 Tax=Flavobacterium columnare TaxID=996 RepID=A0A437UBS1_9FLAO|nr:hypothetical protein [Flavobacterium columnare]RVU91051.1 hypothetical protein EH230_09160 [Flavobacterium columnare]